MSTSDKKFIELLVSQRMKMNGGADVAEGVQTFGELRHEKQLLEKVWLVEFVWNATRVKMRPVASCRECSRQKVC